LSTLTLTGMEMDTPELETEKALG